MNAADFLKWLQDFVYDDVGFQKPLIMGILNTTPDSFSDGYPEPEKAYQRAMTMLDHGADIIDIGGESSRPGARAISVAEELSRTIPVIKRIRATSDVCISIDTYKPEIMEAAVGAGASIINDIYALSSAASLKMAATLKVPVCLMHMQGNPASMQIKPQYTSGVIADINDFFSSRIKMCIAAGITKDKLIIDPGFGFGKSVQHNLCILQLISAFKTHQRPVLLGVSRKSTIGAILNKTVSERLFGSIAATVHAAINGAALIRTHDVDATQQALRMLDAIMKATCTEEQG